MITREDKFELLETLSDHDPQVEVVLRQLAFMGFRVHLTVDTVGRAWADDFRTIADGPTIQTALKRYIEKL